MPRFNIPVSSLSSGIAKGIQSFGGNAYEDAYEKEVLNQSKIGQALASMRKDNAEAEGIESQNQMRSPEALRKTAMLGSGIPLDAAGDVENYLSSGRVDKYQAGDQGPVMPKPEWFGKLGNIGRELMTMQQALTLGDKNVENLAKAYGMRDNLGKQDQVIAGSLPASRLAQAVAASKGDKLVDANEWGVVDKFTGAADDSSSVAKRYGTWRNSETGKNAAQAGASNASAANSRASADQHKAQTDLIRSKIGQNQITTLPDGTVVSSGPNAIPPKLTELQGKAQLFGSRAAEADKIINELDTYRPSAINTKQQVEGWPVIGGVVGPAVNKYVLTETDQKAEQAQRDFINAILRQESGAVIAEEEFDNAKKQYFPQPGDSRAVIDQKARNRKSAINGLRVMAGPAADMVKPSSAPKNVSVDY